MKAIRIYQVILLILTTLLVGVGNATLGFYAFRTYEANRVLSNQIADKHELIAKESERIAFYNTHGKSIQDELMKYEGVALTTPNLDKASTSLANMSREERLAELKRRHAERQNKGRTPAKPRPAKMSQSKTVVHTSAKPSVGTPLKVSAPAYLGKTTVTPVEYINGEYTLSLNGEIEYIRFLEWYKYLYSQYPFLTPEIMEIKVHDKNIFGTIPTNITVTATLKLLSK